MKNALTIAVIALLMVGGVTASFISGGASGTNVNVPSGKTMVYFIMDNSNAVELRDALCHNYNYQLIVTNEDGSESPNPVTCAQFADSKVKQFAVDNVMAYRKHLAEEAINTGTAPSITD